MIPREMLRHGAPEPPPAAIPLRAGPLTLQFEHGDIRYVVWNGREVIRRIYVAVRDENWGTVPAALSELRVEDRGDSFAISYLAAHRAGPIDFAWRGTIEGDAQGTLRFAMDGAARSSFRRNRIGICVLYPIAECAGAPVLLEHSDGATEETRFPELVGPQLLVDGGPRPLEPFVDLRAVTHEVAPGRRAELRLSGERFELEDQRNWIDASYKLYGTPLSLPFPVEIAAGTEVNQSVELRLHSNNSQAPTPGPRPPTPGPRSPTPSPQPPPPSPLPRLGLGVSSTRQPLDERAMARLKALSLSHLRVDLRPDQATAEGLLDRATAEARALGLPLEIGLRLSGDAERELAALRGWLERGAPPVSAWMVFDRDLHRTLPWQMALARKALGDYAPGAPFGGGSAANFTEINRDWSALETFDLLGFAPCPQIHAGDDRSLVETPAGLLDALRTARAHAGGRPLHIGPITLRQRFNAVATTAEPEPAPGVLPPQVDPRQLSLLGAGWTLAALSALAAGGAASASFYETSGWRGVLETAAGSPLPGSQDEAKPLRFPSLPGGVFPLYFVFAAVAPFASKEALPLRVSQPLRIAGLTLRDGARERVLLANLGPEPLPVSIPLAAAEARARLLHEGNAEAAMAAPEAFLAAEGDSHPVAGGALTLELPPYALAIID
jgi:hypothetical protein